MLARPAVLLVLPLLGAALLAGCADGGGPPADAPVAPAAGQVAPEDPVAANGTAPTWRVGQWWDHKWFLGSTATEPFTVKTLVAEDRGPSWLLATDDDLTSAIHAAFIFPTLGEFTKGDALTGSVGENSWPWYRFPLADDQAWSDRLVTRDGNGGSYDIPLDISVRAEPAIVTAIGTEPGFQLEARSDGRLFARYDYVPAIGWTSQATFYDITQEDEASLFIVEMSAMGSGYSGPYFDPAGDVLSTHFNLFVPTAPAPPNPTSAFTVAETHTNVLAFPFSFAAAGAHHLELVAPDGRHWEVFTAADQDGNPVHTLSPAEGLVYEPAAAGDWHVFTMGAGAFVAGGGLLAYGITQQAKSL